MRAGPVALTILIVLLNTGSVHARDPFDDDKISPPADDPAPLVVPPGIYYVTETYVGGVVETVGATTTYTTATVHESTGTYARVIDTVGTGASSAFDGRAFNGRGALTDGRALAGTYYENFVLTADGYVPVSIVFFQDDAETRRQVARLTPSPVASVPLATPTASPRSSSAAFVATPSPRARPTAPATIPTASPRPTMSAGVALAADGPTLVSAEVLRGRLVEFWPRVFANGAAVPLRSWRLLSAGPDHISANSGTTQPFVAQWIQMPAPGIPWILRFEVFSALAPTERLEALIAITVRSPALID